MLDEIRAIQERRRRRVELVEKTKASVLGWIIVGTLGWLIATGAQVAERAQALWQALQEPR